MGATYFILIQQITKAQLPFDADNTDDWHPAGGRRPSNWLLLIAALMAIAAESAADESVAGTDFQLLILSRRSTGACSACSR